MAEQEQNRTEQATPFKLEEARKKGQVAKSLDFTSFALGAALLLAALISGAGTWYAVARAGSALIRGAAAPPADAAAFLAGTRVFIDATLGIVLPVAGIALVFGVLANVVQSGPVFSGEPVKPKLERINPVQGFKRLYNKKMLFETLKSVLKLVFFVAVLFYFFAAVWPHLPELGTYDVGAQTAWFADWGTALLFRLVLALALIALLDLVYVRYTFSRQMMMSRRELKEEVKRREGDPLIRAKIRELQRERLKQTQSVTRVGEADVLITNPTHLAVALRYVRGEMDAPQIIAKGAEESAGEMRRIAARRGVPIVNRPRLARRLYRRAQVGQLVPPETFVEVARIYSTLDSERRRAVRLEVAP